MSDSMLGDDPLKTARALQKALEGMTEQLAQVKTSLRRGKRVIAVIVISLLIDVAVTIGVSIAVDQASNASAKANTTVQDVHDANLQSCHLGNIRLARQKLVLNGILRTPPHSTAARRAYFAHARAQIALGWEPRNCAKVYRLTR